MVSITPTPEMIAAARRFADAASSASADPNTWEGRRAAFEAGAAAVARPEPEVSTEGGYLSDGTPVRWYNADTAETPLVIFAHGGGWVQGSMRSHDQLCRDLAARAQVRVVSIEYPLAPEDPYPAAVDCLMAAARELRDARTVYLAGDSAGGYVALSAALELAARDEGVDGVIAWYPVADDDFSRQSYVEYGSGFGLDRETMIGFWEAFSRVERSPRLLDRALGSLPPVFLHVAEFDVLRDEARELRDRLLAAEVHVDYAEHPGTIHGFARYADSVEEASRLFDDAAAWLKIRSQEPT